MARHYVDAINTPGLNPNMQTAWETFVMTKCSEAHQASFKLYQETMTAELSGKLPCNNDVIREKHEVALQKGIALFDKETFGIAATTTEKYLKEIMVGQINFIFQEKKWQLLRMISMPIVFMSIKLHLEISFGMAIEFNIILSRCQQAFVIQLTCPKFK